MRASLARLRDVDRTRGLGRALPQIPEEPPLRWTVAAEADLAHIRAVTPALGEEDIRRRWRDGVWCVVSWLGDVAVYTCWDADAPVRLPYLRRTFRPRPGDTLIFEVATALPYRGRGIDRASAIASLHRARARGCTRSIAFVAPWNTPVVRVTRERMGGEIVGRVGYWNVPFRPVHVAGGAPRLGPGDVISLP